MELTDNPTTTILPLVTVYTATSPFNSSIISPIDSTSASLTNPSIVQTTSSMEPTNDPTTAPLSLYVDIAPTTSTNQTVQKQKVIISTTHI